MKPFAPRQTSRFDPPSGSRLFSILAAAALLAVPACGDDDDRDPGDETGSAPVLERFETSSDDLGPDDATEITAIVSDPDGPADLIGAWVEGVETQAQLVALSATAPGTFTGRLRWDEINADQAIDAPAGGAAREFDLVVRDNGSRELRHRFALTLACPDASSGLCAGACAALSTDVDNCQACNNACVDSPFGAAVCLPDGCDETCFESAFRCVNGCQGLAATEVTPPPGVHEPRSNLAFDSRGRPSAVMLGLLNSLFYVELVDGVWTATDTGIRGESAALALDAADRPHIVFAATFLPPPQFSTTVGYAFRDDDGIWQRRDIETGDDGQMQSLGIALDAAGTVHATYWDGLGSFQVATRQPDGSFARETPADDVNGELRNPSLAITPDGQVLIAASGEVDGGDPAVFLLDRGPTGAWRADPVAAVNAVPRLALSPQGTPMVAFASASEVLLASASSATWNVEPVYQVAGGSPRPTLAVDSEGRPHIWVTSSADGSSVAYLRRAGDRWDEFPWSLGDRAVRFGIDKAGVAHVFHQIEKTVFHATLSCQGLAR